MPKLSVIIITLADAKKNLLNKNKMQKLVGLPD
jgi:hypothetical protein